jgi:hypothetical protein
VAAAGEAVRRQPAGAGWHGAAGAAG